MSIEVLIEKDGQNFVVFGSKNLYEETYDGTRKFTVVSSTHSSLFPDSGWHKFVTDVSSAAGIKQGKDTSK